jgi:hypothetical protein
MGERVQMQLIRCVARLACFMVVSALGALFTLRSRSLQVELFRVPVSDILMRGRIAGLLDRAKVTYKIRTDADGLRFYVADSTIKRWVRALLQYDSDIVAQVEGWKRVDWESLGFLVSVNCFGGDAADMQTKDPAVVSIG